MLGNPFLAGQRETAHSLAARGRSSSSYWSKSGVRRRLGPGRPALGRRLGGGPGRRGRGGVDGRGAGRGPGVRGAEVDAAGGAGATGAVTYVGSGTGTGSQLSPRSGPSSRCWSTHSAWSVCSTSARRPASCGETAGAGAGSGTGADWWGSDSSSGSAPGAAALVRGLLSRSRWAATSARRMVHGEGEAPPLLDPQMHDVRAEQDGRDGRCPQETEPADRRDDRAQREGEEEHHGGAPTPGQHRAALGAPGPLRRGGVRGAAAVRGAFAVGGVLTVREAFAPGLVVGLMLAAPLVLRVGVVFRVLRTGRALGAGLGHGEVPGARGLPRGCQGFRQGVRGNRGSRLGRRLFGGPLPQLLGVPALHGRPSGQQPDGGTEAFRRSGLVELVLPAEPHRHQVGGPGPDDDCVDEAAAAHTPHRRGTGARGYAN